MPDRRKAVLLARMHALSQVRRRRTMQELAQALKEEARAEELERRSRKLTDGHELAGQSTAAILAANARMAVQLARLAERIAGLRQGAAQTSDLARNLFGQSNERASRIEERLTLVRRQLQQDRQRKDLESAQILARKLLLVAGNKSPKIKGDTQ